MLGTVSLQDPDVELHLPAQAESVAVARQMVRGIIDVLGWGEGSRTDISIAITEACTNAVLHAYPDGAQGGMDVVASTDGERLFVCVRDRGRGFTPTVTSPQAGLGLGLPLILAIADEVTFAGDDGVTEVRMLFSSDSRQQSS